MTSFTMFPEHRLRTVSTTALRTETTKIMICVRIPTTKTTNTTVFVRLPRRGATKMVVFIVAPRTAEYATLRSQQVPAMAPKALPSRAAAASEF